MLLSMGDPAGVGPEITLKAWDSLKSKPDCAFAVIAPFSVIKNANQHLNIPLKRVTTLAEIFNVFPTALPIIEIAGDIAKPGRPSSQHAKSITHSIVWAVETCLSSKADALITNPIAKDVLYDAVRVGLATVHLPLKEAVKQLNTQTIMRNAQVMQGALKCDFGISEPRLSLTGLNPHAGENGALGHEEDPRILCSMPKPERIMTRCWQCIMIKV